MKQLAFWRGSLTIVELYATDNVDYWCLKMGRIDLLKS